MKAVITMRKCTCVYMAKEKQIVFLCYERYEMLRIQKTMKIPGKKHTQNG